MIVGEWSKERYEDLVEIDGDAIHYTCWIYFHGRKDHGHENSSEFMKPCGKKDCQFFRTKVC